MWTVDPPPYTQTHILYREKKKKSGPEKFAFIYFLYMRLNLVDLLHLVDAIEWRAIARIHLYRASAFHGWFVCVCVCVDILKLFSIA